ncbi:DUF4333 domain-containing protein, partial [Kitasatospora sp. NPDC057198]|uniref:DUF4333 domain-containing protein n=1 Tax=Kitasatospora sp. NPDC057198 TaxID=3346046 RepID=UPI0036347DAA
MAVAAAAAALLAGCSAEVHVGNARPAQTSGGDAVLPKVSADKLEKEVAKTLAEKYDQPEPTVTCPGDLAGKVGTTMRCKLTAEDGSSLGLTVTVTSATGTGLKYDIKVDDLPTAGA